MSAHLYPKVGKINRTFTCNPSLSLSLYLDLTLIMMVACLLGSSENRQRELQAAARNPDAAFASASSSSNDGGDGDDGDDDHGGNEAQLPGACVWRWPAWQGGRALQCSAARGIVGKASNRASRQKERGR